MANFRCFGQNSVEILYEPNLTCLIGGNGTGKTAAFHALMRLFGVSTEHRQLRLQDFHVEPTRSSAPTRERKLSIEAWFRFPELSTDASPKSESVADFFHAMSFEYDGSMQCRIRLDARWTDDGTIDGFVETTYRIVRTPVIDFDPGRDCQTLRPTDRGRIQFVYIPALRDGASQVASFLRGRIWRSITWSEEIHASLQELGGQLNSSLATEKAVATIREALVDRWHEVHHQEVFTNPEFRPVALRLEEFVRHVDVLFRPDEHKRERSVGELSDGQRSLFHIAMTSALLDVEFAAQQGTAEGFEDNDLETPDLTIIGVEEPENSLSPYFLSRIMEQLQAVSERESAQAIVASHSPGVLSRVDPTAVRYFRLSDAMGAADVRSLTLPEKADDAAKYIREAVRTFPELYFARHVILEAYSGQ